MNVPSPAPLLPNMVGLARTWTEASEQQQSAWLAAMPAQAQLFTPRPGQKPRTAFLATLGEIITTAAA